MASEESSCESLQHFNNLKSSLAFTATSADLAIASVLFRGQLKEFRGATGYQLWHGRTKQHEQKKSRYLVPFCCGLEFFGQYGTW